MKRLLVTGGAGFIGSSFVELSLSQGYSVVVLDALTYAGHTANLQHLSKHPHFVFVQGDIRDRDLTLQILREHKISALVHLAAESHVDNSISGPLPFIETNVLGSFHLLEATHQYLNENPELQESFRFLHVSTDEVFGELGDSGQFNETTRYAPNSPYSASKAASDHLARAWHHTYKIPVIVTNCSNNYGPRQFPEKLIPLMISRALQGLSLPVYGKGLNSRDWLHVEDHCRGLLLALEKGQPGETYCFGGRSEKKNIEVVQAICQILSEMHPRTESYEELIEFVTDRPGHDWRYAIDPAKAETQLGFQPRYSSFQEGLKATVQWYSQNPDWMRAVLGGQK